MKTVGTTGYLVVKARRSYTGDHVTGMSSARFVKGKPTLEPDEAAVKITLILPTSVFDLPSMEATINVLASSVLHPEATVTVEEPS